MPSHPLDPLLKPRSVALVGASPKQGSPGAILAEMVMNSDYKGKVFAVNPNYHELFDQPCYTNLASLPEPIEHVVLAVGNDNLEQGLADAIKHGAKAATIYANCILPNDADPKLQQRLTAMAHKAGIAVCGGNGMGIYNIPLDLYMGIYPMPRNMTPGGISFIAQSGSAFAALAHNGCRLKFNLCVSSGNEMVTTVADYMDWALAQENTRVIGLFLETARDPKAFTAALKNAAAKNIPVVILKVGKSPLGAQFAQTHTGAIVGSHAAYDALFQKYGVVVVNDFNEMAATLTLLQPDRRIGPGALAAILESGGLRELVSDIAHDIGVEFAAIDSTTRQRIQANLEPGLQAENPLDAWGSNQDFENRFYHCMSALMDDSGVAAGVFFTNFRDGYYLSEAFYRVMKKVGAETNKPIAMANCYGDLANNNLSIRTTEAGIPFIDGTKETLLAIKHLFEHRERVSRQVEVKTEPQPDQAISGKWRERLISYPSGTLSELDTMALFEDFSIPVPRHRLVNNTELLRIAASQLGFPLVLKTAEAGIDHKSDQGGVVININTQTDLIRHYEIMSDRLGPAAMICEMIQRGVEIGLGSVIDPQFGPVLMVAAGGIMIELISDQATALAPVTHGEADSMIASLKVDASLKGVRGQPATDRAALVKIIISLSAMVVALADCIRGVDINPVIVTETGAVAVDGLVKLN